MTGRKKLLITNVPVTCSEEFLAAWVEARGYRVFNVNLIRDVISGTSPSFAYVQLMDESKLEEATRNLNGRTLINHTILVRPVIPMRSIVRPAAWMKIAG
jgi:hypothetical protein